MTGLDLVIGGHSHSFLYDNSTATGGPLPQLAIAPTPPLTDAALYTGPCASLVRPLAMTVTLGVSTTHHTGSFHLTVCLYLTIPAI